MSDVGDTLGEVAGAAGGRGPLSKVGEGRRDRKRNQVQESQSDTAPLTSEKGSGLESQLSLRGSREHRDRGDPQGEPWTRPILSPPPSPPT